MSSFPVYFLQLTTRELESFSISQQENYCANAKLNPLLVCSVLFIVIIAVPVFSKRRIFKVKWTSELAFFRGTEHKDHREFISAPWTEAVPDNSSVDLATEKAFEFFLISAFCWSTLTESWRMKWKKSGNYTKKSNLVVDPSHQFSADSERWSKGSEVCFSTINLCDSRSHVW